MAVFVLELEFLNHVVSILLIVVLVPLHLLPFLVFLAFSLDDFFFFYIHKITSSSDVQV